MEIKIIQSGPLSWWKREHSKESHLFESVLIHEYLLISHAKELSFALFDESASLIDLIIKISTIDHAFDFTLEVQIYGIHQIWYLDRRVILAFIVNQIVAFLAYR